jgi:co-chaperonin GroES (HSP10)
MKKSKSIWNYIDMLTQTLFIFILIYIAYETAENLERYIYRYTTFPFIACVLIFTLGMILGRAIERTKKNKPVGLISKKMAALKKKKNVFIFSDDGETYTSHKEIIEDIKSGEIVHVKQFQNNEFEYDEYTDIYRVELDDLIDVKMDHKDDEEDKK